jgi:hypothetical protein
MPNYEGYVKRIDLNFRTKYLELKTAIYEGENSTYTITVNSPNDNFEELKKDFDYSYKIIGTPVNLSKDIPQKIIKIIPNIKDSEISKDYLGIGVTPNSLLVLLNDKFLNISFYEIKSDRKTITILIQKGISLKDKNQVLNFLDSQKHPSIYKLEESSPTGKKVSVRNPVFSLYTDKSNYGNYPFLERDRAVWYENIDDIFSGKFTKKDLYFYNKKDYTCYIDFTSNGNINLRNHLLLYNKIYLSLPIVENCTIKKFFEIQKIDILDFLDLVEKGRIKILLIQPEFRYDKKFLAQIWETNKDGIIGRKSVASLQQIALVELSKNYLLNDSQIIEHIPAIASSLSKATKIDYDFLYSFLTWPIRAPRESFETLLFDGIYKVGNFSFNRDLAKFITGQIKGAKDLELEFLISAPAIHIANSLNATYFPSKDKYGFSDSFYSNIIGHYFNIHNSFNTSSLLNFKEHTASRNNGKIPIELISLIEIDEYPSLLEIDDLLSSNRNRNKMKQLLSQLSELDDTERKEKINLYNNEVKQLKRKKSKNKSNQFIDLGTNASLDAIGLGTGIPFLGAIYSLITLGGKKILTTEVWDKLAGKIENELYSPDQRNIHFLTQINRVAKLK